jgi:hypothetical protein
VEANNTEGQGSLRAVAPNDDDDDDDDRYKITHIIHSIEVKAENIGRKLVGN